jgi:hypothetical protein
MGFRFHRSVRLLPGVRLNLGLRGMSVTAGIPGLSVNVGPRGVYRNLGLPGTGLSHRERIDTPGRDASTMGPPLSSDTSVEPNGDVRLRVQLSLDANGRLVIRDTSGGELAPAIERRLRAEQADGLFAWLDQREHEIDAGFDELSAIHLYTPSPEWSLPHTPEPFDVPEPAPPAEISGEPVGSDHGSRRGQGRRAGRGHGRVSSAPSTEWRHAREAHDRAQAAWPAERERQLRTEPEVMERALEDALDAITWPRATHVRFALDDTGARIIVDVDLPELEDMPSQDAERAARGFKLNVRTRPASEVRDAYARHVHGVLFRVTGTAFHVLPALDEVVISGYSQRRDPATARMRDDHLVSLRVTRAAWSQLDFGALEHLDPVACLATLGCVHDLRADGTLGTIEPLASLPRDEGAGA